MSKATSHLTVSLDGYVAGVNQTLDNPFGFDAAGKPVEMHDWMFQTADENKAEIDDIVDAGAFIMGRNMFGPIRDEWDLEWKGWWGENPPYHAPVFVLSHYDREPLVMEGGTTFTFVTDGIQSALDQARAAAGERTIAIAGGASTVNQFLNAGLIDELFLHVVPQTLGRGERLFEGVLPLKLEKLLVRDASLVTHKTYRVLH